MARSRSRAQSALNNTLAHDDFFGMPSHPDTTPSTRRLRPVLVLISFDSVRHVAEELCGSNAMPVTRQDVLPALTATEERAIYTYGA